MRGGRDLARARPDLVVEDAAEVVAVREHVGLPRQVGAAAVHKVHARQPAALRDLLQPQVLLRAARALRWPRGTPRVQGLQLDAEKPV